MESRHVLIKKLFLPLLSIYLLVTWQKQGNFFNDYKEGYLQTTIHTVDESVSSGRNNNGLVNRSFDVSKADKTQNKHVAGDTPDAMFLNESIQATVIQLKKDQDHVKHLQKLIQTEYDEVKQLKSLLKEEYDKVKHLEKDIKNQSDSSVTTKFEPVIDLLQKKNDSKVLNNSSTTDLLLPFQPGDPLYIENPNKNAFAACLMVMDDNHRLAEWLAYHYLMLPLRYLVILPDPYSNTWPKPVLDKWRPFITIEEWNETSFLTPGTYENMPRNRLWHNERQGLFYKECAFHLHRRNLTWVSLHDVDEYVVLDDAAKQVSKNSSKPMSQPGVILNTLNYVRSSMWEGKLPKHTNYILPYLVTTYRRLYGVEESKDEEVKKHVPDIIDPYRFDTLRYRHFGPYQIGKPFLDVSKLNPSRTQGLMKKTLGLAAHTHTFYTIGPSAYYKPGHYIKVNHYLGSWESYNSRQKDPRKGGSKSREIWEKEAKVNEGVDDTLRPWIGAFVKYMGETRSKILLSDVGVLPKI